MKRLGFVLATWFGCGLSPVWPGTVGTLRALPIYFAIRAHGPVAILAAALVLAGVLVALAAAPSSLAGAWAAGIVLLLRAFEVIA